jgi:HlyD family secretion protein
MLIAALLALCVQDKEETHVVQKRDLTPVFELEASFEAGEIHEARLRFESGTVEAALVRVAPHGGLVKKGDALLVLERGPLEKQIAAAKNELRGAKATLDKARADQELAARGDALALAQAELSLKEAEASLKNFEAVEGPHLLLNAELQLKQMEDMLADQKEELEQLEKMYKGEELTNATSEIVVRRARRALERAHSYVKVAKGGYDTIVQLTHPRQRRQYADHVENARHSLAQLRAQQAHAAVQREVELAKAEAAHKQHEEQLAKLSRDLEALTLTAPFDGRVFWGPYQNGQWTPLEQAAQSLRIGDKPPAGQVLLTLCGGLPRLRAELPEADYFALEPGARAQVTAVALPGKTFEGRLGAKGVAALARSQGPAFDVRLDLDAPPADALHGMKAKATLRGPELKGVLVLPVAAVRKDGDKRFVKVVKDGRTSEREVKTGLSDGRHVRIREGLSEGEAVKE